MAEREKVALNLARFRKAGKTVEVVIFPEAALRFREGKTDLSIDELVHSQQVFSDAQKGLAASPADLQAMFSTEDADDIIRKVIREGELQITAEQRKRMAEQKRRAIVGLIHRSVVDPRTHLPHPEKRIELAMEQAKVRISDHKKAEDQLDDVLAALKPILPIKYERKRIALRIPAATAAKAYAYIKSSVATEKEDWLEDGSLRVVVTLTSAVAEELLERLGKLTAGGLETEVIEIL